MYKCVSGYKRLCEKQGASLLLSYYWPCVYMQPCMVTKLYYVKHYITDIYFQCLVDAHSSNPEARELV